MKADAVEAVAAASRNLFIILYYEEMIRRVWGWEVGMSMLLFAMIQQVQEMMSLFFFQSSEPMILCIVYSLSQLQ